MNLQANKVLVLNASWRAIAVCTIQKGLENICNGAFIAINFDNDTFLPQTWEEWIKLPIGERDDYISTSRQKVRIPRVIIAKNYRGVPKKKIQFNRKNLLKHYDNKCVYTGKTLKEKDASIEHLVPRSQDGEDGWHNCVPADRDINSLRGDMSHKDFERKHGYKKQYDVKPAPKEKLVTDYIENSFGIPEWRYFLDKKQ